MSRIISFMASSHGHGIGCLGKWKHKDIFIGEETGKLDFRSYDIETLLMYHEKLFP